jgi:hypothetical protein
MTDNSQLNLLQMQLEALQRWRRDAWEAFAETGDQRAILNCLPRMRLWRSCSRNCVT